MSTDADKTGKVKKLKAAEKKAGRPTSRQIDARRARHVFRLTG